MARDQTTVLNYMQMETSKAIGKSLLQLKMEKCTVLRSKIFLRKTKYTEYKLTQMGAGSGSGHFNLQWDPVPGQPSIK